MSTIGYGSALNEQSYRPGVILEAELSTVLSAFRGSDDTDCAFPVLERAGLGRGSNIKARFSTIDKTALPLTSGVNPVGNEQNLSTEYEDSLDLRYFAYAEAIENIVVEQNLVSFDRKNQKLAGIALRWAYLWEQWQINQMVGNTVANTQAGVVDFSAGGGNSITAQDANHVYFAAQSNGTANANDAAVAAASSSVLDSRVIDDLVTRAQSPSKYNINPIAPCDTPFGPLYVLVCHPVGFQQIKVNGADSDFYDISRAAIQGGLDLSMSPLNNAEGFIYDKTLVLKSDFCPQGITAGAAQANTLTAAFFGARAGHWLFGEGYTDGEHLGYEEFPVLRRLTLFTDTCCGFKRTIVNGTSWASIRVVHYSPV